MNFSPRLRSAHLASVALLLMAACAAEDGGNGPDAPPVCVGAWQTLQWNGTAWSCVDLRSTGLSGGNANGFEASDAWGFAWDGSARGARTWAEADADCRAVGARLPTVTELYRANHATGTGDVGSVPETASHWTNNGPSPWFMVRLSDGLITPEPSAAVTHAYRCVWPDRFSTGFEGNACYGPPGAECFTASGEGGRARVDAYDRPSLPYGAAIRECAFVHGHLATELALAESIQRGLPNGSGAELFTSEHEGWQGTQFAVGIVRWSGTKPAFADAFDGTPTAEATWGFNAGVSRSFRCSGTAGPIVPSTEPLVGEWTDVGRTHLKSTTADVTAATLLYAIEDCRKKGGHLPTQRDLGELIQGGLTGGSGASVLTADLGAGNYVGVVKWSGAAAQYDDTYPTWATHVLVASASNPYRCVWYPLDGGYAGPAACNDSCFASAKGTTAIARTWADSKDRTPATYGEALRACAAAGGHLPSFRDYAELIRDGLANGSAVPVWTSDLTSYQDAALVQWTGVATTWSIAFPGTVQLALRNSVTTRPFRCVWSNELRW